MAIHIKDTAAVAAKITALQQDGKDHFHIVTDFDSTLTPKFVNGERTHSSYSFIRKKGYMPDVFLEEAQKLFAMYHPIEMDPSIDENVKVQKMNEWWTKGYSLMIKHGMSKGIISDIVQQKLITLRDGVSTFFATLAKENIPTLVFSAGPGDLIREFLYDAGWLTLNMHVVSNFFIFDSEGIATGYSQPFVHTFNKNEYVIKDTPYYNEVERKDNVILLGDILGDARMADGMEHKVVLKIGFLNENEDDLLEAYMDTFDIVLTSDSDFSYVNDLLTTILTFSQH